MKKQEVKDISKKLVKVSIVLSMLCLFGVTLNAIAVDRNGDRMPAHTSHWINTNEHFNYINYQDVKVPYLTDIFKIEGKEIIHFVSIGDFFIWIGGYSFFLFISSSIFLTGALKIQQIKEENLK